MILLLGASGYIGQAFAAELKRREWDYRSVSRQQMDYTSFPVLLDFLQRTAPRFVINAAGHTGKPNVDACESQRDETLMGNTMLPHVIAHACAVAGIPWGHVSSGCIFSGAKVQMDGQLQVERDLTRAEVKALYRNHPERFHGFTESDEPNFCFGSPPCSFYSGTKALAEKVIKDCGQGYIWRLRIPFDEFDNGRNYLSKLLRYDRVYENINSLSHRSDFVRACLDLWENRSPFGIYNVTNPGAVSTGEVVELIKQILRPQREFAFWKDDSEFYRLGAVAPRSNCIMDSSKLLNAGVTMRPVLSALTDALENWKTESAAVKPAFAAAGSTGA
jgi:dTDP-4-dehydrorhamnose reductase